MSRKARASALLLLCAAPAALRADWSGGWRPERVMSLFLAETPYVEKEEEWRVSGSFLRLRRETERASDWALRMDYGVMEKLQGRVMIPYRSLHVLGGGRSAGLGDPMLEMLYDIAPVTTNVQLAGYGGVMLATGDEKKGLGRGETAMTAGLRSSHALGAAVIFLNAGLEWDDEGGHIKTHAAVVYEIDRWLPVLEVNGLAASSYEKFITPGVVYRTWGGTEWGLAFPVGLGTHARKDGLMLRVTRHFGGE